MTWTKLGDEYGDQCWKLSDAAVRLHTEALVWSNRRHLDGHLDKDDMRHWARRPEAAAELVSYGWWTDEGDHYLVVYHLGWQRTAAEWLHQSEVNKANQAKRKARRGKNSSDHSSNEPLNESFNEPLSESFNETNNKRDGTGQDRKNAFKGTGNSTNGNGTGPTHCRYCHTEIPLSQPSAHRRGHCNRPLCMAAANEAKANAS